MNSVNLVQRGISAATHPVSGKSGKLYGNAVASPMHGGVLFPMSFEEYSRVAHDIVGNPSPGQQWVPEFSLVGVNAPSIGKCDRCSEPAVARWDRFLYCEPHAPGNAIYQDGSGQTVEQRRGSVSSFSPVSTSAPSAAATDVRAPVEERLSGPIEEETELPQETLRAPVIGTADEDSQPEKTAAGVVMHKPETSVTHPVIRAPIVPPPGKLNAVEAITTAVVDKVMDVLPKAIDTILEQKLGQRLNGATPPTPEPTKPAKTAAKKAAKKAPGKRALPVQSEFAKLRNRAKELGINSYGKSSHTLQAEIQAKTKPALVAAGSSDDDVPPF